MTVKFSQFLTGGTMMVGDISVGLRNGLDYQFNFPGTGINDSAGNPLLRWLPGAGANTNYVQFTSASSTNPALINAAGGDTNVTLLIGAKGTGIVQFAGTDHITLPAGTAGQALPGQAGGIRANTTSQYLDYWSTVTNSWVDLTSGSAASNLTYITQTDETAFAPNSQPLEAQPSGFLTSVTAVGVVVNRVLTGTTNEIAVSNGTGAAGNPVFSIPTTFIAPGTIAAVTSVSAPEYLVTGATDGVISILPQAHAGTYNLNLPTTAGTSGYLLTSAGGGSAPMTWSNIASIAVSSISGTANEITASASTGAVTLSIPSTFIAPGTIQATTSSAAASFLLNGSGSGTISILPQAAAGTYNFNLPITAGTSGYLLTSAGGAGSPMTWSNIASIAVSSIAGTANEITASASTGAVTLSIPSTFIAPGSIAATTSSAAGSFLLNGSGSGTISILAQAAAGTYNFNLPITAGTSGYVLTSAGGAGAPMTWSPNAGATAIQTIDGDSGSMTGTTVTVGGGTTGLTTSASSSSMSLTGTLKSGNGGTQVANSTGSLIALGLTDSGSANAYAVTIAPAPAAYAVGQTISFIAANANTTASTLAVNALGTKAITKHGATALVSGDIVANQVCTVVYDGTQFQLENPVASAGAGTVTSVATGTGLRGGTITTTGTVNLATQNAMSHRLTLTSGTPVTTGDVTAATTLYLTPYKGTDIDIYSGSAWVRFQQAELSITTAGLSASTTYDVFVDYNSGTPQLSLTAWSNSYPGSGARATALAYQNGILVKSGTATSRYIGTVYTDGSTQFNDSSSLRTLYNYYNRVNRSFTFVLFTASWGQSNNNAWEVFDNSGSIVPIVIGVIEDYVNIICSIMGLNGTAFAVGIGVNSKTVNTATINNSSTGAALPIGMTAHLYALPQLGYQYYVPLEYGTTATAGWYANQVANSSAGLVGTIMM